MSLDYCLMVITGNFHVTVCLLDCYVLCNIFGHRRCQRFAQFTTLWYCVL